MGRGRREVDRERAGAWRRRALRRRRCRPTHRRPRPDRPLARLLLPCAMRLVRRLHHRSFVCRRPEAVVPLAAAPGTGTAPPRPISRASPSPPSPRAPAESRARSGASIGRSPRATGRAPSGCSSTPSSGSRNSPALLKTLAGVFLMDRKPLNAAIALKKAEALEPLDTAGALSAGARLRRHGARRLGAPRARTARGRAARDRPLSLLARPPRLRRRTIRRGDAPLRGGDRARPDVRPGVRQSRPVPTRRSISPSRRSRSIARPFGSIAVGVEPSPWPPLNLGILLRTRGAADEAEAALSRGAHLRSPASPARTISSASCSRIPSAPTQRVQSLERAAQADPAYPEPHYALVAPLSPAGTDRASRRGAATFQRLKAPPRPPDSCQRPRSSMSRFGIGLVQVAPRDRFARAGDSTCCAQSAPAASLAPRATLRSSAICSAKDDRGGAHAVASALATCPQIRRCTISPASSSAQRGESASAESHFLTAIRLAPRRAGAVHQPGPALSGTFRTDPGRARESARRLSAPARVRSGQPRRPVPGGPAARARRRVQRTR